MEQCFKQKSSFRTIRIILFSLSMLFAYATNGYAQNMVRGVVTDVTGDPLPGVSVVVKGTTTGTTTDIDGRYSINASNTATLEFSYIGMNKQEIKVNGRSTINIILKEDVANLDEVVVVGYGTQKKAHLTGSVATVSQKDMLKTTASNMSQTLVGKLPGLITQQSLGQPGSDDVSILIRGYSSFSGSGTVLVLVDGVERAMGQVDPNDVESVTILKDAASCAVYGMKAANGVVLVTTKHGQEGKTDITYRGSMTLSHATTLPKMMNGTQYMQWYNLARKLDNNGVDNPYFTDEEIAVVKFTILHPAFKLFFSGGFQYFSQSIAKINNPYFLSLGRSNHIFMLCTVVTDTSFNGQALIFKVDVLPCKTTGFTDAKSCIICNLNRQDRRWIFLFQILDKLLIILM